MADGWPEGCGMGRAGLCTCQDGARSPSRLSNPASSISAVLGSHLAPLRVAPVPLSANRDSLGVPLGAPAVVPLRLWYRYYCGAATTVVPLLLWYRYYCGTATTVVPLLLWYRYYCGAATTVVPLLLWYRDCLGVPLGASAVVPLLLWYRTHPRAVGRSLDSQRAYANL